MKSKTNYTFKSLKIEGGDKTVKGKRNLEKALMKLVDDEIKSTTFSNKSEAVEAIIRTTQKLFSNYRNRNS